ncbi:MAG: prepilin-type N-terminal cleavage/methylation domain-containing protein, partial [Thiogranum sp.]
GVGSRDAAVKPPWMDSRRPRQAGTSPAAEHPGFKMAGAMRRGDGFTLLEVLVAVVIMAVIMTTAFGTLRLGGRSWEAGVTRASDNERFRTVADLMRRQVSQVIPMTWPDEKKKRIAFEGNSNRLRFVAPAPQQHRQAGLFEYGFSTRQDGPDTDLILSFIPFNPDAEAFQRPASHQQLLLVAGLQRVSFDYFGSPINAAARGRARKSTQPPSWHQRWDAGAQNFPNLIRVRMEVNEGQQSWPELYLALPAGGSQ